MNCQKCNSERLLEIQGKTSDCFGMWQGDREYSGYVPDDMGIGSSDDIEFTYCLDCGQIQGVFPVFGEDVAFKEVEDDVEDDEVVLDKDDLEQLNNSWHTFDIESLPDGGGKYRFVKKI